MKWNIDFNIKTFTRFKNVLQFALISSMNYPAEFVKDTTSPKFYELLKPGLQKIIQDKYKENLIPVNDYHHYRHKRAAQSERHGIYSLVENLIAE